MSWRERMHEVIFEADTPEGKAFDAALLVAIVISVLAVVLESVASIRATRARIAVFMFTVLILVLIMGALMYAIEGAARGFTSIPQGIYWAIVTMTTVGYGDLAPTTIVGRAIAALAMILGYSLIIIPTGIFSVELVEAQRRGVSTQHCAHCSREGHDLDARFWKHCGEAL